MTFYTNRKGGYVRGRDPFVDEVMAQWKDKYSKNESAKVVVSTFNVNGRNPPCKIDDWLDTEGDADVYVIGLQEMDLSVGTYIMENGVKEKQWISSIQRSIPHHRGKYRVITSVRLVGMLLVILGKECGSIRISDVSTSVVATGVQVLMNKLGNKGGVCASLLMNNSRIAFVNSHLAAGDESVSRRNLDYREISQITFSNGLSLFDHDILIWLGDLNYRINSQVNGLSNSDVRRFASSYEMTKLIKYDQLREQQSFGRVFVGFKEGSITFPPTYKYDIGTDLWDSSEKARSPAWCDRILWWTGDDDTKIGVVSYTSIQSVKLSDHKPVRAELNVEVRTINQSEADSLYEDAIREADKKTNENLPQISLNPQEVDFGEVYFMRKNIFSIIIKNEGKSGVRFKLKERPGVGICAEWLNVHPQHGHLTVGQQVEMSLSITVDKRTSWLLENNGVLSDILVLSLDKGRDHFIPVSATYTHRVFGMSLSRMSGAKEDLLISLDDTPSLPVSRPFYALVSSIRKMGVNNLSFGDFNEEDDFDRIRECLEKGFPSDIAELPRMNIFSLYSALLRLMDSLKDPLIPAAHRSDWLLFSQDASRLWGLVDQFPPENRQLIQFITDFLRELLHLNPSARDQLRVWADVIVRETSTNAPSLPREEALRSIVEYSRDTALFHLPRIMP
ncbi:hypothetical protein PMAYCL1PPCAC_23785 [Pristionchus mayeri]|uniref:Uncharacterized protein n=1 Tax=Pristionchus mayeri TaxID=1317129 RepID=A0AAN5D0K8_9BILA|nr:hypothetical protein PMAYCL1PPCAC_23785 [Pristionchus mayeri]